MSDRTPDSIRPDLSPPLLEIIRRKEAEVKRRLAAESEAAQAALAAAECQARELIAAAEADGRREGDRQRQEALARVEREAEAIIAQARAEAARLQRLGAAQMAAAIAHTVAVVIGVRP